VLQDGPHPTHRSHALDDPRNARKSAAYPVEKTGSIGVDGSTLNLKDWQFGHPDGSDGYETTNGTVTPDKDGKIYGHTIQDLHRRSHGKDCKCPVAGARWRPKPAGPPSPQSPSPGGNMSADITYTEVLTAAQGALAQSDQDTASIRTRKETAYAVADQMVAAHVDPVVINAQMEYADRLSEAEKSLAAAGESAGSVAATAEKYHGGMQEASDSAPGQIAERQFHEGS
jgi:hypothetical protein